ncbi:MAG: hypothetical protein ACLR2G_11670 [Phascolarctobacterium faecium]
MAIKIYTQVISTRIVLRWCRRTSVDLRARGSNRRCSGSFTDVVHLLTKLSRWRFYKPN